MAATGEIDLSAAARFNGHIEVAARNSEGLGRYLGRLGAEEAVAALLDGRALDLGADVSSTAADLSLRNLRLTLGPCGSPATPPIPARNRGTAGGWRRRLRPAASTSPNCPLPDA